MNTVKVTLITTNAPFLKNENIVQLLLKKEMWAAHLKFDYPINSQ